MVIQFIEPQDIENLYPLTLTRPAANLRCGILTVAEKWMHDMEIDEKNTGYITRKYLQTPGGPFAEININGPCYYVNGSVLPNPFIVERVKALTLGETLYHKGQFVASFGQKPNHLDASEEAIDAITSFPSPHFLSQEGQNSDNSSQNIGNNNNNNNHAVLEYNERLDWINRPNHIFLFNGQEIINDFNRITLGRQSTQPSLSNRILGNHPIFIEEGAKVECAILNASEGPIYIGKNAEIMEGCLVRGPLALCEGAVLKMGTKAYSNTTLGPYSVAGGEISNVVFWGFSNKGHDGFLGNAVLGEWCNIGADTNASNLKNTYDEVKIWNYKTLKFEKSGQQFCGLIMGDHSKCGINTMFNTGTVVGVACNLFGASFPRQFVPDFSWGGAQGFVTHKLEAVHKTAALVMPRRKRVYGHFEKEVMEAVFALTATLRS